MIQIRALSVMGNRKKEQLDDKDDLSQSTICVPRLRRDAPAHGRASAF